jgi:hypothetical protein
VINASECVATLSDAEVEQGGRLHPWTIVRRQAVDPLARVSKMALDAGVLKREAEVARRLSSEQVAAAWRTALNGLLLSSEQENRMRGHQGKASAGSPLRALATMRERSPREAPKRDTLVAQGFRRSCEATSCRHRFG